MKKIFKILLMFLAFSPVLAMAGPFDPPKTDISILVLNQIFGGLLDGGQNAFGPAIQTFNSAILALGGILAAYTILAGTLGTAHDGEMLGKKFSSVWIPIRYALGTALVLPVIPGGYCVMQQIVMWLIVQGVGLADMVWQSYISSPTGALTAKMSVSNKQNIVKFAEGVALAQGCTYAAANVLNNGSTTIDKILQATGNSYNYAMAANPNNPKNEYWFGDQSTSLLTMFSKTNCGKVVIPGKTNTDTAKLYGTTAGAVGTNPSANSGKLGVINTAFTAPNTQAIYDAHVAASTNLITDLGNAAKSSATSKTPIPYSAVISASDAYIKAIESATNAYIGGAGDPFKDMKAQSQTQGWFLAGAWYTRLTMLNQQIQQSVNIAPSATYKTGLSSAVAWLDSVNPEIRTVQSAILSHDGDAPTEQGSVEKDNANGKTSTEGNGSFVAGVTSWFAKHMTGINMADLQNDTRPPVMILQEAGSRLIDIWEGAMGVLLTATAITGVKVLGNGFDAGPMVMTIIGFLAAPIAALVGIGFTLGYMLPNLPFLMWIGVILGWVIMVIEAIIAAPLWAVMHLHPNGDDLTGKGANGYMLVLGLTLRPVLTIFGLIAALAVTDLMGEFVNKVFFSVFQTGDAWGFKSLLVTIFAFSVYTMAQFSLFKKTFALMHVIPDQLLRWIGGGGEQLGQYAGSIADGAGRAQGAIAAASSFAGEKALSHAQNGVAQARQMKDSKDNKQLALKDNNAKLDQKYGEGTSSVSDSVAKNAAKSGPLGGMGWSSLSKERQAQQEFGRGLDRSAASGGEEGAESYKSQMQAASENNFSDFGGSMENASQSIASNIEQSSMKERAEGFGREGSNFVKMVADKGESSGNLSVSRASKALSTMSEAKKIMPQSQLSSLLEQASQQPSGKAASSFFENAVANIQLERTLAKSSLGSTAADISQKLDSSTANQNPHQDMDMGPSTNNVNRDDDTKPLTPVVIKTGDGE